MMNSYRVFCRRKKETDMESNQVKKYCIIGVIAAAVCLFVMNVKVVIAAGTAVLSAAAPLLLGIVIAYILNILLNAIYHVIYFAICFNNNKDVYNDT